MADYAHNETDKRIAELEKRLSEEYRQAYKETKDKLEKYLSDFKRKDEKKRQEVENGTLSEKDYKTWRRNQMLTGQRWTDMVDTLANDMNNVNVIAAQIVSGEMPEAFSLNANYSAYEIENGYRQNYGFTLYDRDTVDRLVSENPDLLPEPSVDIPADLRWNKQKIVSNITQAVLQGKSIPEIAKSMQTVVGMNKASAVRNARTAMTGAQNAGRQQAYERAAKMGIKLQKEWMATLDGRTRHSHGMADGQKVDINGMFSVGGCKMRYPGDVQNGTAAEIYNCRCTMCTVEPPEIMQGEEPRMTYSEWVQTKEGQETTGGRYAQKTLDNGGGSGIIKEKEENHDYHYLSKEEFDKLGVSQITPHERHQAYSHRVIDSNGNNIQEGGYIRTSNSFSINKALRNGDLSSLSDDDKLTISTLEGIMDNNPSKVDIMVDRYTDPNYIRKNFGIELKRFNTQSTNSCMQEILNNHINECIQENGFISTSWNPEENVFKDSRPVQLVISIPQGTPMYITDNSDESEIILKRGTKFKVTNCDTTQNDEGDDLLRIFLEVIKE